MHKPYNTGIMWVMRDYEFYYTQDGSVGLYSYADDDVYHSKFGALTEAWEKFVIPSGIANKINKVDEIKVLDVCYGIGYNTKSLMSYVINSDKKFLIRKKSLKKFLKKLFLKHSIDSKYTNNTNINKEELLESIESIDVNNLSHIKIDCLDINSNLVKISPLLKTVITPQEIYTKVVPKIFDCFDSYWKIKKWLGKISYKFAPTNKKEIKELLDLKFNNDYDEIKNEYRIHKFVNYILIDELVNQYKDQYINLDLKKIISKRALKKFFDKSLLKYALYKQKSECYLSSCSILTPFLHNIYYRYLSKRYKKVKFEDTKKLFKVNFYVNDARKSILQINEQYDYIFLDAFTFSKAPELWTVEFMAELYNRLSPTGILMTYSNSALVRNTFLENNFYVGKIYNEQTGKFIGTVAAKEKSLIKYPLTNFEIGLCATKAGIPYHDYNLSMTKEEILKNREIEFKSSGLMTSSQYMRSREPKGEL